MSDQKIFSPDIHDDAEVFAAELHDHPSPF
jgi:hypothetical protein